MWNGLNKPKNEVKSLRARKTFGKMVFGENLLFGVVLFRVKVVFL